MKKLDRGGAVSYHRNRGMKLLLPTGLVASCFAGAIASAADAETPVPPKYIASAKEAKASFEHGDYVEAVHIYESMLVDLPDNVYMLSNLGVTRFRAGKFKLAEDVLKRALVVAPDDDFSHCMLGIVKYGQGRFDDAINALTKALAINPKNATAHRYLAFVAKVKGWHEAARKELETAEKLDAGNPNLGDFLRPVETNRIQPPSAKK